jgi:hypothetical protein
MSDEEMELREFYIYENPKLQHPAYMIGPSQYARSIIKFKLPNGKVMQVQGWAFAIFPEHLARVLSDLLSDPPEAGIIEQATHLPVAKIICKGIMTLRNGNTIVAKVQVQDVPTI